MIFLAEKVRPTPEMVENAWDSNDDGGGLAWREGTGKDKVVVWKKGINDVEEMQELIAKLPLPFVAHFRIASSGGIKRALTHPFPVTKEVSLDLEGRTKGAVLFHNGNLGNWEDLARQAAILSNTQVPSGRWNDTRAIAWLCSIYGPGFFEFLSSQKGVIFWPNNFEVFTGTNGWEQIEGVWCSNNYFTHKTKTKHSVCRFGQCKSHELDRQGYCSEHKGGVAPFLREREAKGKPTSTTEPGGAQTVSPFPRVPKGTIISLEVAVQMSKTRNKSGNRLISKGLLKKIRAHYDNYLAPGRRGEKARRKLIEITERVAPNIPLTGSVH